MAEESVADRQPRHPIQSVANGGLDLGRILH